MRLLSECFPLLIGIGPMRYDAEAVARMAEAFDPFHQRGERYAFISIQPQGSVAPGPSERKLIMDWVGSPSVRIHAAQLCVGSAAVVDSALMRGALTALLWIWKPPFPVEPVATPVRGIDYCLDRLAACGVSLPDDPRRLAARAEAQLAVVLRGSASSSSVRRATRL